MLGERSGPPRADRYDVGWRGPHDLRYWCEARFRGLCAKAGWRSGRFPRLGTGLAGRSIRCMESRFNLGRRDRPTTVHDSRYRGDAASRRPGSSSRPHSLRRSLEPRPPRSRAIRGQQRKAATQTDRRGAAVPDLHDRYRVARRAQAARLADIDDRFVQIIRKHQPFRIERPARHPLRRLQLYNDLDKHRRPAIVFVAPRGHQISARMELGGGIPRHRLAWRVVCLLTTWFLRCSKCERSLLMSKPNGARSTADPLRRRSRDLYVHACDQDLRGDRGEPRCGTQFISGGVKRALARPGLRNPRKHCGLYWARTSDLCHVKATL